MIGYGKYIWAGKKWPISRMLKMAPSVVLGSTRSSTYPRGYASGLLSPAALLEAILNILQRSFPVGLHMQLTGLRYTEVFF
jgi:hypothetical protein